MDDDFNTAQALGHLFDAVRLLNRVLEHNPADKRGPGRAGLDPAGIDYFWVTF